MIEKFLPQDAKARKAIPVYSGFVKYFPRAMAEVAKISKEGNDQHNPGKLLHWDRSKSGDELDALLRHILEGDWGQVAWRAMANLEKHLELKEAKEIDPVLMKRIREVQPSGVIPAIEEEENDAR